MSISNEAWVVFAKDKERVRNALIVLKSLRCGFTTKKIVLIFTENIPESNREVLAKQFDDILMLPKYHGDEVDVEIQAKIFCFNIIGYQKIVFLPISAMILQNSDDIFKMDGTYYGKYGTLVLEPSFQKWHKISKEISSSAKRIAQIDSAFEKLIISELGALPLLERYDFSFNSTHSQIELMVKSIQIMHFLDDSESGLKYCDDNLKDPWWNKFMEFKNLVDSLLSNDGNYSIISNEHGNRRYETEPIAVIGMSCRMPGANNTEEYWNILYNGECTVRPIPDGRWTNTFTRTYLQDNIQAGFVSCAVDEFDANFFRLSPKEMSFTDPQHRLLLEVTWESLEDAGINPLSLRGTNTGVFTGIWTHNYSDLIIESGYSGAELFRAYMGNGFGVAPAKIAYFLGLNGPNIFTESGCSSSSVGVGLAIKSLRSGETNLALACGVNLILNPFTLDHLQGVLSSEFRCKTFDSEANGFARAEGCGALVLKRLSDAVRDGDRIHALLRGYGSFQEGDSRSMGTPTVNGETRAMMMAMQDAGVNPNEIQLVEAHGTGTSLGDPIEVKAISQAFLTATKRKDPLIVTSGKANIGHTESCAGIAGIIKTILSFQHKIIPQQINIKTLNPEIEISKIPAKIPLQERINWVSGLPKMAAVNSFGITGTDTCIILEEAPILLEKPMVASFTEHFVIISAQSEHALEDLIHQYSKYITENPKLLLQDIVYTANTGRAHFRHRAAIKAKSSSEIVNKIASRNYSKGFTPSAQQTEVCFLFTGQGSQHSGMGQILYENFPIFATDFDICNEFLKLNHGMELKSCLWDHKERQMRQGCLYDQTSIFVIEYCLVKLWESLGIVPSSVLGHSLGEFAAAASAGILTLNDALNLLVKRCKLIDTLPPGKMIAVNMNEEDVRQLFGSWLMNQSEACWLDVAALNSPEQTTLAGPPEVVFNFAEFCKTQNIKCTILDSPHAFHSRAMDPIIDEYRKFAKSIQYTTTNPKCLFISGVEGRELSQMDSEYWVKHTRSPVQFIQATLAADKFNVNEHYIEVGPHPILCALMAANLQKNTLKLFPSMRKNPTESSIEFSTFMDTVAKLHLNGYDIDFNELHRYHSKKKISLPFYQFQRKKFWLPPTGLKAGIVSILRTEDYFLLGRKFNSPLKGAKNPVVTFQNYLNLKKQPFIRDHKIGEISLFPAAGFIYLSANAALVAAAIKLPYQSVTIENFSIMSPLIIEEALITELQTTVTSKLNETTDSAKITLNFDVGTYSLIQNEETQPVNTSWLQHTESEVTVNTLSNDEGVGEIKGLESLMASITIPVSMEGVYSKFSNFGFKFGKYFQSIYRIWRSDATNEILAQVKVPLNVLKHGSLCHPVVIDSMIQAYLMRGYADMDSLFLPIYIKKILLFAASEDENEDDLEFATYYVHVQEIEDGNEKFAVLYSGKGKSLAIMKGLEFAKTDLLAFTNSLKKSKDHPEYFEDIWKPIDAFRSIVFETSILESEGAALINVSKALSLKSNEKEYFDESTKMSRCIGLGILITFWKLGWAPEKVGENITTDFIMKKLGIVSTELRKPFKQLLRIICEDGYFEECDLIPDTFKIKSDFPDEAVLNSEFQEYFKIEKRNALYYEWLLLKNLFDPILPKVFRGEESALELFFPEDIEDDLNLSRIYKFGELIEGGNILLNAMLEHLIVAVFKKLTVGNSGIKILEIGAGTGSTTQIVISILQKYNMECSYMFTDISPAFLHDARNSFQEYSNRMDFKLLDIDTDPKLQGFAPNQFHLVIASQVLHATKDLSQTCQNIRHLITESGLLFIAETLKPLRLLDVTFSFLPGYWNFTDFNLRQNHCVIGDKSWRTLLRNTGFSEHILCEKMCCGEGGLITAEATSNTVDYNPPIQHILQSSRQNLITFGNASHLEKEFVNKLNTNGVNVMSFNQGEYIPEISAWKQKICFKSKTCAKALFDFVASKCEPDGIIFFIGLPSEKIIMDSLFVEESIETVEQFLNLLQTILEINFKKLPRLYLVTRGKACITDSLDFPNSSLLSGMIRSFCTENGSFLCKIIDLNSTQGSLSVEVDQVFSELWTNHEELMIAFQNGIRHVARLLGTKLQKYFPPLEIPFFRFQLVLPTTKTVADIKFCRSVQKELDPLNVEIEVRASGLNFRNIFSVLKPTEAFQNFNYVGEDISGRIVAVGSQVRKWKVGDRVLGVNIENEGLPSHVVAREESVISLPTFMTFEEAATLPTAFFTAYHCLISVANLKRGETVLIHTASGGVGLMAIQIAKNVGANIIATAGSNRKRNYLKNMGLPHVYNSRDLTFGEEIQKITDGCGVDVVLNSLTGFGFKETSLKSCANNARFIEMSKLNIWTTEEVFAIRPDVFYSVEDLTTLDAQRSLKILTELDNCLREKTIHPIAVTRFDAANIREALVNLEKALHIGKVVLTMPNSLDGKMTFYPFNRESTYLITGGTKGIGLEVLKWMCNLGAENVVIMARNDPPESNLTEIRCLKESGKNIVFVKADIGDFEQCKHAFGFIHETMPPLRGIMHCAGLISDATIPNQSIEKYREVLNPKLNGAWNLHLLTQNSQLEHFLMFSSAVVGFGSPGQSNYVAANTFLDTLAHYRVGVGLPGTSINWGQWGEVGVVTGKSLWTKPLTTKDCLNALHDALKSKKPQFAFLYGNDVKLVASQGLPWMKTYFQLIETGNDSQNRLGNISAEAFWEELEKCETDDERISVIQTTISRVVSSMISMDPNEKLDPHQHFQELGVDSLMMIQLKNTLQHLMGSRITISTNELIECTNVDLVTKKLFQRIFSGTTESESLSLELRNKLILEDSKIWDHITVCENILPASKLSEISTVLLTGVTGNFGPYLLESLSSMSQIKSIYCLIRPGEKENGEAKLQAHFKLLRLDERINLSKVNVVEGDITVDKMGIELEEYKTMAKEVEMVVHCAVYSNHLERYNLKAKCRSVNVTGTQRILEFASTEKLKHVYHSSSMLGMWIPKDVETATKMPEDWPEDGEIENAPDFGYGISKYISDRLVAQAVERGIPCKAFRFPKIFGDSKTGRLQIMKNHFALKFLYYIRTGMMPDIEVPLQVFSADTAADVTFRVFFNEGADSGMYNVLNPHRFFESDIGEFTSEYGPLLRIAEKYGEIREDIETFKTGGCNAGNKEKLLEILWKQASDKDVDKEIVEKYAAEYEITDELLSNPSSLLENEAIKRYLENQFGYEMSLVKFEVFEEHLKKDGESSMLYPFLEFYTRNDSIFKLATSDFVQHRKQEQWVKDAKSISSDGKIYKLIPELKEIMESPLETVRKMIEFTIRNAQEIFSSKKLQKIVF